ncbi:MAG: hypothetical protein MJZ38_00050 [archaeon]|nr:hypothetical protein [archaeon]
MDNNEALEAIRKEIKEGKNEIAGPMIMDLASKNQDDPMTLLTCASMLLTIGDRTNFPSIISVIMGHVPEDADTKYQIVQGLISLGALKDAGKILADMEPSDKIHRARAAVFHGTDRFEDALAALGAMTVQEEVDRVLKVQALGALGKHDKAIALAKEILSGSTTYRAGRCYISALVLAGREKEAAKYAKERMKDKSADGYALMAFYQWLNGNSTAGGAFSSKALKIENKHLGALETIGLSFADKGSFWEAKIAAGAINEIEPGSPAVFRILALCKD